MSVSAIKIAIEPALMATKAPRAVERVAKSTNDFWTWCNNPSWPRLGDFADFQVQKCAEIVLRIFVRMTQRHYGNREKNRQPCRAMAYGAQRSVPFQPQ